MLATGVVWAFLAAAPTISVELDYVAPEACPPRARLEAELAARSDKLTVAAPGQPPQAHVSLHIVEQKRRFVGTSKVRTLLSGVTKREFKSAQCEALVQAAALATALLLDPEGTRTGVVAIAVGPVLDAGAVNEVDAGADVAPALSPLDAGVLEPVDAGTPTVEAPARDAGQSSPQGPAVEVWAGAGVSSGVSGAIDGLAQLAGSLAWNALSLRLSAYGSWGQRVASAIGAAQYLFVGGRFDTCARLRLGPLRLEAGVGVFVSVVPIAAPEAEVPGRALGWLIAPAPLGRVTLEAGRLRFAVEGGVGFNVRTERYVIDGAGVAAAAPRAFGFGSALVGLEL